MVKLTKSIELTLSDILLAIDQLPPKDRKAVVQLNVPKIDLVKLAQY